MRPHQGTGSLSTGRSLPSHTGSSQPLGSCVASRLEGDNLFIAGVRKQLIGCEPGPGDRGHSKKNRHPDPQRQNPLPLSQHPLPPLRPILDRTGSVLTIRSTTKSIRLRFSLVNAEKIIKKPPMLPYNMGGLVNLKNLPVKPASLESISR